MELSNTSYTIQGNDVAGLAREFGTPLYVYDAEKILKQLQTLKNAFSHQKIKIKYAAKALTNINILKLMKMHGAGVDVVSLEEARLALKAGFSPSDILFTPNCVSFKEILEGVEMGLTINIDNISILEQFGNRFRHTLPCCIRLNPHIMAGGNHKISTGHVDSKFGISIYQLPHVMRVVRTNDMHITGLHMHTGSDILDAEIFLKVAEILFGIAMEFPDLEFIDFGSGFKVGYKENDIVTNVYDLGLKLGKAFDTFCESYGRKLEMWFEPGKYLVSEAGVLLVQANVIKTTPATVFVGVNSGFNHLLRPMMYEAYHHIINVSNPKGTQRIYSVVGNICETDTLGWDRKLNEVREGDILAIKNAGAYGFSMASNYNSRVRPAEVLIYQGNALLIRKRETMEDILANQLEVDLG